VQAPRDRASSKAGCRTHAVLGTAIGAGVGAATAAGVLVAIGGSDSTFKILFNFTGVGAVGGLVIGSAACRR
jgi:high-affinity Fe2+/Pb2+ permease